MSSETEILKLQFLSLLFPFPILSPPLQPFAFRPQVCQTSALPLCCKPQSHPMYFNPGLENLSPFTSPNPSTCTHPRMVTDLCFALCYIFPANGKELGTKELSTYMNRNTGTKQNDRFRSATHTRVLGGNPGSPVN